MKRGLVAGLCLAALAPVCALAQAPPHRLFVSVLDAQGHPASGLTLADFTVLEAGTARNITRVGPATDPMRLVLLIDTSRSMQPSIEDLRRGILAFVDGIPPQHEIALVTIGDTPVVRSAPTIDHAALKELAKKITTRGATVLIESVGEMYDRFVRHADDRWSMFIIVTGDGVESSEGIDAEKFTANAYDMQRKDVVVHAIVVSVMGQGRQVQVSRALVDATGGHYDAITAANALPEKLADLAKAIAVQYDRTAGEYLLEYATDSTNPAADVKVSVTREDVNVTMSRGLRIR
jgi:VWFA-related protein